MSIRFRIKQGGAEQLIKPLPASSIGGKVLFYIEGKTHTIRVDETANGHISMVLFSGSFQDMVKAKLLGTIKLSNYDADAFEYMLMINRQLREQGIKE